MDLQTLTHHTRFLVIDSLQSPARETLKRAPMPHHLPPARHTPASNSVNRLSTISFSHETALAL